MNVKPKKLETSQKRVSKLEAQTKTRDEENAKALDFFKTVKPLIEQLQAADSAPAVASAIKALSEVDIDKPGKTSVKTTAVDTAIDKCWANLPDTAILTTKLTKAKFDEKRKALKSVISQPKTAEQPKKQQLANKQSKGDKPGQKGKNATAKKQADQVPQINPATLLTAQQAAQLAAIQPSQTNSLAQALLLQQLFK